MATRILDLGVITHYRPCCVFEVLVSQGEYETARVGEVMKIGSEAIRNTNIITNEYRGVSDHQILSEWLANGPDGARSFVILGELHLCLVEVFSKLHSD